MIVTTVGILGVVHNNETRLKYHLSLDFIKELILEFNPHVICGEVLPGSWELYVKDPAYKGYWGEPASEYWELIFPLCAEHSIEFVPVDWAELDVWKDFDPFHIYSGHRRQELSAELERWNQKQLEASSYGLIPFNSVEYDNIAREKYQWLETVNPQAHIFRWICRHQIMVQRIKNAVKKHAGKTILCIAGADHNHCYYDGFMGEKDLRIVYPLRK